MLNNTGYVTLDFETKISYELKNGVRKEGVHGPSFRALTNDLHTIIYGDHPDRIKLLHKKKGFARKIPYRVGKLLLKSHTLITQNGKFDLSYVWHDRFMQRWLKKGGKLWDCSYVRYILSHMRHAYPSLAEMQKIYLKVKTKKDRISYLFSKFIGADEIIAAKERCPRVWKLYCEYGIEDGRTPMLIFKEQYKEAKRRNMLPIIELFNSYLLSLTMMEVNGIDVDENQLEINEKIIALEELEHLEKAQNIAKKYWDDPRLPLLNINSNDHKSLLLFGGTIKCKVKQFKGMTKGSKATKTKEAVAPKEKYTTVKEDVEIKGFGLNTNFSEECSKKGFYKTGEEIIERIYAKSKNEEAKEFCKWMKLAANSGKMLSTYIRGIKKRLVNGKLYINLNNTKTVTTRLSSSKPNMQNIPSEGRYNELIQGLFIAPLGWTCVSFDFSQLEVYVKAWLSNDRKLIDDLVAGVDFHSLRACWFPSIQAEGITYEQMVDYAKKQEIPKYVKVRKEAKPIGFGKDYGKGYQNMAKDTGIPELDMKEIYRKEDEVYWQAAEMAELNQRIVEANTKISYKTDYAEKSTKGTKDGKELVRRFFDGYELLPIKVAKGSKLYEYDRFEPRHIGIYRNPCGLELAIEERATRTKTGDLYKYYLSTQIKNYPMQSGASIVQACTTVEMFQFLLRNPDKIKMLNEIHDSKWFIVKNEYLTCIVGMLSSIMLNVGEILKRRFNVETELKFANDAKFGVTFANMVNMKDYINSKGENEWPIQKTLRV